MANILYISLNSMTESLGESQVVQYLLGLAKHHNIHLFSFEKTTEQQKYLRMKKILSDANIQWHFFTYSNRYGVLSSAWQIMLAVFTLSKLIKNKHIQLIHARSLIPAVIGMLLKKLFKVKLLFDIRGFAIDEKIIAGRLQPNSFLTTILKKLESLAYKNADHIVTLTHVSKPIISERYAIQVKDITVIPTCANIDLFKVISDVEKEVLKIKLGYEKNDFIILHNGSLNGWVDFEAEIKLFEQIALVLPNVKFLFLNNGQHELILHDLEKRNFAKNSYKILSAELNQVYQYLNIANLCMFFIKPSFAKQASAPTKFAELIACHLYSVTNKNYGDMDYYFNSYPVGLLLDLPDIHQNPRKAAQKVIEFIETNKCRASNKETAFQQLFSQHFSMNLAVNRYSCLYHNLT